MVGVRGDTEIGGRVSRSVWVLGESRFLDVSVGQTSIYRHLREAEEKIVESALKSQMFE